MKPLRSTTSRARVLTRPLANAGSKSVLRRTSQKRDRAYLVRSAAAVVRVLSTQPGISLRKVRAGVRVVLGSATDADTDAAIRLLGTAIGRSAGERGAYRFTINLDRLPADVRVALDDAGRAT